MEISSLRVGRLSQRGDQHWDYLEVAAILEPGDRLDDAYFQLESLVCALAYATGDDAKEAAKDFSTTIDTPDLNAVKFGSRYGDQYLELEASLEPGDVTADAIAALKKETERLLRITA